MLKHLPVVLCLFVSIRAFAGDHILRYERATPDSLAQSVEAAGGTLRSLNADAGFAVVSGLSDDAANALALRTGAAEALPDFQIELQPAGVTGSQESFATTANASNPTLAPAYPAQWNMRAIGADTAWAAGRLGSPDVTVAVIDTGIDYTHADLAGRVDLSRSKSFTPDDDAFVAGAYPGAHPITDLYAHGTHVASTITSNAVVAAGVTSRVTLIGVKVINRFGIGSFSGVLDGVLWAADHGADVANMSIAGWLSKKGSGRGVAAVQQVFNYAHRKGMLIVVAGGNEETNLDRDAYWMKLYCGAANVVCVSATGPLGAATPYGPWFGIDTFAWYSNYGRSAIDVAAPGGTYGGFVWAACSRTAQWYPHCATGNHLVPNIGTSMAAPHVSGLAALLVEDAGHGKPSQVKARLLQSADDLGQRGTDPYYGKGRINVPRALGLVP